MKFTDKLEREWNLVIDVAAMRRAKKAGIDLSMPVNQLQEFVMDDVFLADALFAILSPSCAALGITSSQFDDGLNGNVIESARESLWSALEAYFTPGKASMLRAALASVRLEMEKATQSLISDGSDAVKES